MKPWRLDNIARISRALGDPGRLQAVAALQAGELCVCQLVDLMGLAPSTVSRHMTVLKDAGLVESRKDGRWNYYRLADSNGNSLTVEALGWVQSATGRCREIHRDRQRLSEICCKESDPPCRDQHQE